MKALFVESKDFTEWISEFLSDDDLLLLQQLLMEKPDIGRVIPGCGGLRKIRIPNPSRSKGKRGGIRIIYLHVPSVKRFYLLDVYDKDEQDDLSAQERKVLADLARALKKEAVGRRGQGT